MIHFVVAVVFVLYIKLVYPALFFAHANEIVLPEFAPNVVWLRDIISLTVYWCRSH